MKKTNVSKRLLALFLALALFVSAVPTSVIAAEIGSLYTGADTAGLANGIVANDTISWPIKIYDYLNDGMLFEYSAATHVNQYESGAFMTNSVYGGGELMPYQNIIGNDYTINGGNKVTIDSETGRPTGISSVGYGPYDDYAFASWLANTSYSPYVNTKSVLQAGSGTPGAFKYMHLVIRSGKTAAWTGLSSPYGDTGGTFTRDPVRYAVIVYRTNVPNAKIDLGWGCYASGSGYNNTFSPGGPYAVGCWNRGAVDLVTNEDQWQYAVIDMNNGEIKKNWNYITNVTTIVFKIENMQAPSTERNDFFDISHVAYFGTLEEATNYGIDASEFSNDPGEYLPDQVETVIKESSGTTTVSAPAPSTTLSGNQLDFASGAAFGDSTTYKTWTGATNGGSGSKQYAILPGNTGGTDGTYKEACFMDGVSFTGYTGRYITMVYRTKGTWTTDPKIGFYLANDTSSGSTTYGYGTNGTSTAMVTLPRSEGDEWVFLTYDMTWIDTVDTDFAQDNSFNRIGAYLPLFNENQKLEIAYIDYHSSITKAHSFAEDAVNYMNNHTTVTSAPTPSAYAFDFVNDKYEASAISTWTTDGLSVRDVEGTVNRGYLNINDPVDDTTDTARFLSQANMPRDDVRYLTIVYRTHNIPDGTSMSFWLEGTKNVNKGSIHDGTTWNLPSSEVKWAYYTFDLSKLSADTDYADCTYVTTIGAYLPGLTRTQTMDIAYIDYFSDGGLADAFGSTAAAYMNSGETVSSGSEVESTTSYPKHWNMGGNSGFTMLFPAGGGGWAATTEGRGGASAWDNGYFDYPIGDYVNETGVTATWDDSRDTAATNGEVVSNSIYTLYGLTNYNVATNLGNKLGYTLYNTAVSGPYTVGLLESSLITVTDKNGRSYKALQYKNDTIDYIARLLESTLLVPETDKYGNYNYNFIKGSKSSLYAYTYDADSKTVVAGIDGKTRVDLATALRERLNITFQSNENMGSTTSARGTAEGLDAAKRAKLIGTFQDCLPEIDTFAAAAYYLLHNLFVDNSYNQVQDEYNYLVLSKATLTDGNKEAYVFDAGFTTGDASTRTTDASYLTNSLQGVVYDPVEKTVVDENGNVTTVAGAGTISLRAGVQSKDEIYYDSSSHTTRFPFLPVTAATGDFSGRTGTFFAEAQSTLVTPEGAGYAGRNYNYVMQANGEFVYHIDDNLFFEFAGDDDVYLFINGELVMDIGAAHSITRVNFNMNDYVNAARSILVNNTNLPGYYTGMSNNEFEALLTSSSLDDATKEQYRRWYKLDLADGQSYEIDFYYMERHGWGANMRIATNIVMTDPALQTNKTAYQDGEEIPYGGIVNQDKLVEYSFSMTNNGNSKLYNLTFTDDTIGVALNDKGLVVTDTTNVKDKNGGTLDASDLVINVSGYGADGTVYSINVPSFTGDTTTTANGQLIQFLKDLESSVTQTESTQGLYAGSGLWKDATVTIRGIYYNLKGNSKVVSEQFTNTVYTTATPAESSSTKLEGLDSHLVRTLSGGIQFYQWAGHEIGIHREYVFAQLSGNAKERFTTLGSFYMEPCKADTNGTAYSWPGVSVNDVNSTSSGNQGTLLYVNFQKPGKNVFYLKLYRSTSLDLTDSVIIPVTVYVTDVEDSTVVLDYGLKAELTETGGIYTNDHLTGSATSEHKIMGITGTTPSYMKYSFGQTTGKLGTYQLGNDNRINFTPDEDNKITSGAVTADGNTTTAEFDGTYSVESGELFFTPTDFMDGAYSIYAAVSVYEPDTDVPHAVGPANVDADNSGYDSKTGKISPEERVYSIDISKEVQMYQKVTVLPANVVYYEDDFAGTSDTTVITYTGTFETTGTGSGSLIQSVDQTIPYGQDPVYQANTNTTMSGNSLHTYQITDNNAFANFTFKGTGFEIIGQTNAADSGTMVVKVTDLAKLAANPDKPDDAVVYLAPVITEFDNTADSEGDTNNEVIHQVPVVRVDGLDYGTYTVTLAGSLAYDTENPLYWESARSHYDLEGYSPITQEALNELLDHDASACPGGTDHHTACEKYGGVTHKCLKTWVGKYITEEEFNKLSPTSDNPSETCPKRAQDLVEWLGEFHYPKNPSVSQTQPKLYIDGVRIFQPYGETGADGKVVPGSSVYYNASENGASFDELRELLQDGKAAVINKQSASSSLKVCTSNMIWTENRNGDYSLNRVGSIYDYLVAGPNNELYYRRNYGGDYTPDEETYQMLLLYVTEDTDASTTGSLQVALRVIDEYGFRGTTGSKESSMVVKYIKKSGSSLSESSLPTVASSTEQYYTIDYSACPSTTVNGKTVYEVIIRAGTTDGIGMLSFTSVKYNGLEIQNVVATDTMTNDKFLSGTTWYYDTDGTLKEKVPKGSTEQEGSDTTDTGSSSPAVHFDMRELSTIMDQVIAAEQTPVVEPEVPQEPTVPEETEPVGVTLQPLTGTVNQTPVKEGPTTLTIVLLAAGIIALLVVTYLLTKKYLHYL